jgi:phosphatidylglycerophosphatase A/predicted alpha/beta hydrolase family esterase
VGDEEKEVEEALRYQYIELSTGTIRYVHRDGEGTPLLFIHGFGGDLDNWLFNLEASENPVYALDLPGHGQSTKALDGDPIECLSQTISEFVSAQNISQCHLVGHSMGGLLAAKFSIENPSLAASLTLLSPAGLTSKINEDYLVKFSEADSRQATKTAVSQLFADQSLVNRSIPHQFFALGFGLGLSPKLPGTLGALPFIYAASQISLIGQVILGLFICIYGVLCCDRTTKEIGQKDPQVIVWDEVAGFYIAMIALPFQWSYLLAAFFLFRAFDILKPHPISRADKKLKRWARDHDG